MDKKSLLFFLVILLFGCTEKVSIEPEFTNDTSWVPQFSVMHNNYQRVKLNFGSSRPSLEVERNVLRLLIEFKKAGDLQFANFDTIDVEFETVIPFGYQSPPVLEQNTEYSFRVIAQYRNGIEQISNTVIFFTPIVHGRILDSIPIQPLGFDFSNDTLYVLTDSEELYRIDPVTHHFSKLLSNFRPLDDRFSSFYSDMSVNGDVAIFAENSESEPDKLILVRLNLMTLEVDRSVKITIPEAVFSGRIFHYDGAAIYVFWVFDREQQIMKFDAETGAVTENFPKFASIDRFINKIIFDGSDFWIADELPFDYRISRFDPTGAIVTPLHQNPVFQSFGLTWDGANFWVFSHEMNSLVKLELERL